MTEQPIITIWDGEAFVPANAHWARKADELFVVGERYALVEHHERSSASHAHYFAVLNDIWQSLPEHVAPQFPTAEVLRAHALIRTGYCNKRQLVCRSKAEAKRMAAFLKPANPFAIIEVDNAVVTEWTAASQSYRAMDKKTFNASKQAVLDWCADLIGLPQAAPERRAA